MVGALGGRREGKVGADSREGRRVCRERTVVFGELLRNVHSHDRKAAKRARSRLILSLLIILASRNSRASLAIGIASEKFPADTCHAPL